VVDAGGRGLVVLLEALVEVVTGSGVPVAPPPRPPADEPLVTAEALAAPVPDRPALAAPVPDGPALDALAPDRPALDEVTVAPEVPVLTPRDPVSAPVARAPGHDAPVREAGSMEFGYEVQYLLDAPQWPVDALKAALAGLGDSLVVVGDGENTWNVHVHVNDVGAAIEAGVRAGRPYRISVVRFEDQIGPPDPGDRGAVVVAAGAGLTSLFRNEGAVIVDRSAPSTAEILAGIRATGARQVVVLPGGRANQPVARLAAEQARIEGMRVGVVPTRSPVQALAALAVRDEARRFEDDMIAMAEAAGACRYAEVCAASRAAVTVAGVCRPGDILGLVEGEVNLIGSDLYGTCRDLLDRLLAGGGELVTLLTGTGAPPELAGRLSEHLGRRWPFVEVQAFDAGQPLYPLVVGVE
jgi:hypothetical protein